MEITAPSPIVVDVSALPRTAEVVSVTRLTKNLHHIARLANLRRVWASGLDAQHLASLGSLQAEVLALQDVRVENLESIAHFIRLRSLALWNAPKLSSLRGVESLAHLEVFIVGDVKGPIELEPISRLNTVRTLSIEGGMYRSLRVPSLAPLRQLAQVERLRIASIRVDDRSLEPLSSMTNLTELFIANAFSLAQFAALANALPNAPGDSLRPVRETHIPCSVCRSKTVLLTGGRGLKCTQCDASAIAKHVARFARAQTAAA